MRERIGFIGLGVMGSQMAGKLIGPDAELFVYNRTKSKADKLVSEGAIWLDSPEEVAKAADITFTIVGYPADVREVYLGEKGIIKGASEGKIFVDMTTTEPSLELEIGEKLGKLGAAFADAPVSGGDKGAREGTLSIMVGAEERVFTSILPYLEKMGRNIAHMGTVGAGQHTKMANQIVIAGTMAGVSEALVYGKEAGLDLGMLVSTIAKGAAGCWTLDNLAPRVINGDFEPGFMAEHFIKDMTIALKEADGMKLTLPSLALTRELYKALDAEGYGREGTQALTKVIEKLSGK